MGKAGLVLILSFNQAHNSLFHNLLKVLKLNIKKNNLPKNSLNFSFSSSFIFS